MFSVTISRSYYVGNFYKKWSLKQFMDEKDIEYLQLDPFYVIPTTEVDGVFDQVPQNWLDDLQVEYDSWHDGIVRRGKEYVAVLREEWLAESPEEMEEYEIPSNFEELVERYDLLEKADLTTAWGVEKALYQLDLSRNVGNFSVQHHGEVNPWYLKTFLQDDQKRLKEAQESESGMHLPRVLGAHRLDLSAKKGVPCTYAQLYLAIASSQSHDTYSKKIFFDAVQGDVKTQANDIDCSLGDEVFDQLHDLSVFDDYMVVRDLFDGLIDRRVEMLKDSAIYVKPQNGACAHNITRLSYDGEVLRVSTTMKHFEKMLHLFTSDELARLVEGDTTQGYETQTPSFDDGSVNVMIPGGQGAFLSTFGTSLLYCCGYHVDDGQEISYGGLIQHFFHGLSYRAESESEFELSVDEHDLKRFL